MVFVHPPCSPKRRNRPECAKLGTFELQGTQVLENSFTSDGSGPGALTLPTPHRRVCVRDDANDRGRRRQPQRRRSQARRYYATSGNAIVLCSWLAHQTLTKPTDADVGNSFREANAKKVHSINARRATASLRWSDSAFTDDVRTADLLVVRPAPIRAPRPPPVPAFRVDPSRVTPSAHVSSGLPAGAPCAASGPWWVRVPALCRPEAPTPG